MVTLNVANQAMFTANASSYDRIELKLQESLNNKLDEQATAKSVNNARLVPDSSAALI